MIKIPENVDEWDIGLIAKLIHEGYDENEILEFKSVINEDTKKIPITACAFANTHGGTIVFGVNNDRTKALSLDQRLIGLEDSDDLKSKITNQLKNIKPDILLSNVQFKESNIKLLNGKVIVIMKIFKSENSPHQFEYKFYKRLSNGNEPMDVEEVKKMILDSQKNKTILLLLTSEGGLLKDRFLTTKELINRNRIPEAFHLLQGRSSTKTLDYFLHNQSYLYPYDISWDVSKILEITEKLDSMPDFYADAVYKRKSTIADDIAKDYDYDDPYLFVRDTLIEYAEEGLNCFESLEEKLSIKFLEPGNSIYSYYFEKHEKPDPHNKS